MFIKLIIVFKNYKKLDCRMDDVSIIVVVVVFLSENVFDKWEKNLLFLIVGWLKIN